MLTIIMLIILALSMFLFSVIVSSDIPITGTFTPQETSFNVYSPFPVDESTGVDRPPTNLSASINGTDITVYFSWVNITPSINVTEELYNWTGQTNNRTNITWLWSTEWTWGNTEYIWFVNATNGTDWKNETYTYTTKGSRYDVSNTGDVVFDDAIDVWDNRVGTKPYKGIYDVDHSGDVTFDDAVDVWDHRT